MNVPVFSFLDGSYIDYQIGNTLLMQNCLRISSTVLCEEISFIGSTITGSI